MKKRFSMAATRGWLMTALAALLMVCTTSATAQPTEEEIIASVEAGVAWLAEHQLMPPGGNGSWGGNRPIGTAGLACTKLMDYATDPDRGLGFDSPFDPGYIYVENVESCVQYILNNSLNVPIDLQGPDDNDPDTNEDGLGIFTDDPSRYENMYENAIALMTMCNTVELNREVTAGPQTGKTYLDVAQNMADYIYYCQSEGSGDANARGSWEYNCNNQSRMDGSVSGWIGFGLGFAAAATPEGCGLATPQFVKDDLALWVDYIQGADGCMGYTSPGTYDTFIKQGHLLQQQAFVGLTSADAPVQSAVACMCGLYNNTDKVFGWTEGWTASSSSYQATYAATKGLLAFGDDLKLICDPVKDWCADFDAEIVSEQDADGSWSGAYWAQAAGSVGTDPEKATSTAWALLTLERAVPPPPGEFTKELTSGPDVDGDGDIDLVVEINKPASTTYDFTITYTLPGETEVLIVDTVPADWEVTQMEGDLGCTYESLGKKAGKGATRITCAEPNDGALTVWAETRKHSNAKGREWYRPTSCGALWLNDGAAAYEIDPATGEPFMDMDGNWLPPIEVTDGICLAAVYDANGDGIIEYDGLGNEDGDAWDDYTEACVFDTDPCVFTPDTDEDGIPDPADNCPFDPDNDADGDGICGDEDSCPNDPDQACVCEVPFTCGDVAADFECIPGAGDACVCIGSVEGDKYCVSNQSCSLESCTISADCAPDEACIVDSCCATPVCVVVNACLDPLAPAASAAFDSGPTITGY